MGIAVGLGLGIPFGGGISTGAMRLASGEANVLAFDFADVGGPSALIRDTTTPANNYNSSGRVVGGSLVGPGGKLTYTAPSPKLTLQSDGFYRFQPHNLYLNSATPANQSITVVSGATYAVVITGTVSTTASGAATGTWTAGTNTFTAATTTLTLGSTTGSGTVHVRRTPSVSDFVSTAGSIIYDLPYRWNSSGVAQGIRFEEARTNLLTYSTTFSHADWAKSQCTITPAASDSPFGTLTASKIVESAAASVTHQIVETKTVAAASTYASSVVVKAAERGFVQIQFYDGTTNVYPIFNLSTGALVTANGIGSNYSVESLPNSWFRISIFATTVNTSASLYIYPCATGTTNVYTGDGTSGILIASAQLELGSSATSPIETFASTVTRLTDNISIPIAKFPYNASHSHTFFATHGNSIGQSSVISRVIGLDGTTKTPMAKSTVNRDISYDGTTQLTPSNSTDVQTAGVIRKSAYASSGGSGGTGSFTIDGQTVQTSPSSGMQFSTSINFGSYGGLGGLFGDLQSFMYVPRRMSNTELQTLTTL